MPHIWFALIQYYVRHIQAPCQELIPTTITARNKSLGCVAPRTLEMSGKGAGRGVVGALAASRQGVIKVTIACCLANLSSCNRPFFIPSLPVLMAFIYRYAHLVALPSSTIDYLQPRYPNLTMFGFLLLGCCSSLPLRRLAGFDYAADDQSLTPCLTLLSPSSKGKFADPAKGADRNSFQSLNILSTIYILCSIVTAVTVVSHCSIYIPTLLIVRRKPPFPRQNALFEAKLEYDLPMQTYRPAYSKLHEPFCQS